MPIIKNKRLRDRLIFIRGVPIPGNKANLRDLIAATGLVFLLKIVNHQFFSLCDLEIWWMPSGNNRAHFLYYFSAATKQLYDWFSPSVRLSVFPSVTPFSPCSHHRIIMKFSGVITNDKSDVHAKGQGQRSKVKVTEVNIQLNRFRTVTPVWIHIWWWNDAYSLMMLRRGTLLFLKVIRQISRSHGSKKRRIWP